MSDALKDLFKDEIQEEKQKAVDIATIAMIRNAMQSLGLDATKVMDILGIPAADQLRYAARL